MSLLKFYFTFGITITLLYFQHVDSQCTELQELIYSYDNTGGSTPATVSFETLIGKSKSTGNSRTGTSSKDSSSSTELSFAVRAWFVEASTKHSQSNSEHSGNSTTISNDEMFRTETKHTSTLEVNPGLEVQVFQTVYKCGDITIRSSKVRRVDKKSDELIHNEQLEIDLASQKLQHDFELEIEKLKTQSILDGTNKEHEIEMRTIAHNELQEHMKQLRSLIDKSLEFSYTIHNQTLSVHKLTVLHGHEIEKMKIDHAHDLEKKKANHDLETEKKFQTFLQEFVMSHGVLVLITSTILVFMCVCTCCICVMRRTTDKRRKRLNGVGIPFDQLTSQKNTCRYAIDDFKIRE